MKKIKEEKKGGMGTTVTSLVFSRLARKYPGWAGISERKRRLCFDLTVLTFDCYFCSASSFKCLKKYT